tara:strand:- start:4306 stop:4842 length:537 start_codon:yes stop_codon:yes gene_type:complete
VLPSQADFLFTLVVFILAVLALIFSGKFIVDPPIPLDSNLLAMNSRVFPILILMGTVIVSFSFLLSAIRSKNIESSRMGLINVMNISKGLWRQCVFLVITITSALLLVTLGFITTMFFLMVSTAFLVGNRNLIQIIVISAFMPVGFYIVVTHVLRTALPEVDIVQKLLAPLIRLLPAF